MKGSEYQMRHKQKIAATLALSLVAVFGSPASAAIAGGGDTANADDPVSSVLTADDPIHDGIAEAALEAERVTGINDPSAGSN